MLHALTRTEEAERMDVIWWIVERVSQIIIIGQL